MSYFHSITESIGRTPLIQLNRITAGAHARIAIKGEFKNPLGSVKDRIGRAMIESAEKSGALKPGGHIIEPTSGNTGIALAFVAAAKGYPLTLTMPESMSQERRTLLALLGANLVLTPAKEGMKGAIRKAEELLADNPGSWMPQQFANPANPQIHRETTAEEIWEDTAGQINLFIAAVGFTAAQRNDDIDRIVDAYSKVRMNLQAREREGEGVCVPEKLKKTER
jgi:cysteine synthase A